MVDMTFISEGRLTMKPDSVINIYIRKGEHEVKKVTFNNVMEYEIHHGLIAMKLSNGKFVCYNLDNVEYFEEVYSTEEFTAMNPPYED